MMEKTAQQIIASLPEADRILLEQYIAELVERSAQNRFSGGWSLPGEGLGAAITKPTVPSR
jgi:hypothetical protein